MKKFILTLGVLLLSCSVSFGAAFVIDGQSQDQVAAGIITPDFGAGVAIQDQGYQLGVDPDGQIGVVAATPGDSAGSNQFQTQTVADTVVAADANSIIAVDYSSTTSQASTAITTGGLAGYANQNVSGSAFFGANDSNGTNGIAGSANGFDHQTLAGAVGASGAGAATQTIQSTDYLVASAGPTSAIVQTGSSRTDVTTTSSIVGTGLDADRTTALQAGGSVATNNGAGTSMQGATGAVALQANTGGAVGQMFQTHSYVQTAASGPYSQTQTATNFTIENF